MNRIETLSPEIASRIAAGEVIERPASVIKEALENSLDAGSDNISVQIAGAGRSLIRVSDNGSGIAPENFDNLFRRHATSKIRTASELESVSTLGFRGEALYSIAAVADVTLKSRAPGSDGWEIHFRAGREIGRKPSSQPEGTELTVRELFFNTPARKRFLKSDTTENRRIIETFTPYAIACHERRFRLEIDQRAILNLPPAPGWKERAVSALNLPADSVLETRTGTVSGFFSFQLLFGDINIQRSRGDFQFVFVNDRPIMPGRFGALANRVFRLVSPPGVFPFFALRLKMPPEMVEVNIHPSKREVRFRNEQAVFGAFFSVARRLLLEKGSARNFSVLPGKDEESGAGKTAGEEVYRPDPPPAAAPAGETTEECLEDRAEENYRSSGNELFRAEAGEVTGNRASLSEKLARAGWLGSFGKCWLLFESGDSLLVMDQHAAHERVAWEKLRAEISAGRVEVQQFLVPVILPLSPEEMLTWEKMHARLEKSGFSSAPWDSRNLAIHGAPRLITDPGRAMRNLLAGGDSRSWDEAELARRACHSAVTAGRRLERAEAEHLCLALASCEDPYTCPHGRPTILEFEEKTLARLFRR